MSVGLGDLLRQLYPDASPALDYRVEDHLDGLGPRIGFWDYSKLGPQPTPQQLAAAVATYVPPPPPTPEQRLTARTGLTVAELKALIAG